jgi:transcription initiation factor TFIIE subunit alpha
MAKSKGLSDLPVIQEFIKQVGGEFALDLVQYCEKKTSEVTDEEIAKKTKAKITDIRTTLNRLHYRGIAYYQKTRNQKTGWYSYTWSIKTKRIAELIIEQQTEQIEKLEKKRDFEKNYVFFNCKKGCGSHPFEIAAEYQFRCPECGKMLESTNNEKKLKEIDKKIQEIQKQVAELRETE